MDVGGEMIYVPSHFKPEELVDPVTFAKFGNSSYAFLRLEILRAIEFLRLFIGKPFTVNNWPDGGLYKWRGLRTKDCTEGAVWSMHRFGGALDFDVEGMTAVEVRQIIRDKRKSSDELKGITRIELDIGWNHIDCKPVSTDKLVEFKP